jgi:hypothetical protein
MPSKKEVIVTSFPEEKLPVDMLATAGLQVAHSS